MDFAQEVREATDQRQHRADEQRPCEPLQIGREEFLHEQRDDNQADEQRRTRAIVDGPAAEVPPSFEIANIRTDRILAVGGQIGPHRLETARPIYDAAKPRRHDAEECGDTREQKHGCDRELDDVGRVRGH